MKKGTKLKIVDRAFNKFCSHGFRLNEIVVVDKVWMETYFCHSIKRPNSMWWVRPKEVIAK